MPRFSIFNHTTTCHDNALAHDIVAHSGAAVMQRLRCDIATMAAAELRGYIRARALSAVRGYVQQAVAERRLSPRQANDLIATALERTVHLVVRELQAPPIIAIPTPHVPLRAAA